MHERHTWETERSGKPTTVERKAELYRGAPTKITDKGKQRSETKTKYHGKPLNALIYRDHTLN